MAIRICPSILNADHSRLGEEIAAVATSDLLHLDVMDNIFVPNQTFTLDESREIIASSPLPVDTHLMIADPDLRAVHYAEAGSASVTFHLEASAHPLGTITQLRSAGARVGIAIKPNTPFEIVRALLSEIDMLLVMTVEPGFGGQKFMSDQLPKIEEAHRAISKLTGQRPWLQVDGGISFETIALAARAGADTFVAGSAIYRAQNPAEAIRTLRELAAQ